VIYPGIQTFRILPVDPAEIPLTSDRKVGIGAFFLGSLLVFILKTTVELLNPEFMSLLHPALHVGFNIIDAMLVNLIIGVITNWLNISLERYLSWRAVPVRRFLVQALITGVLAFLVVALIAPLAFNYIVPYADPAAARQRTFIIGTITAMMMSSFYTAVYFFNQWGHWAAEAERLKRENLHAQFSTLKTQVNPHFLFNSLSALADLIPEDQRKAGEFVHNLASVYRYILQSMEDDIVDLGTDLDAMHAYVFLQQTRFGMNLRVDVNVCEEYKTLGVAPLTLQMLLENANKHNIVSTEQPLTIDVTATANGSLVVKNRIQKKSSVEETTHLGLRNIVNRYALLGRKAVEILDTGSEFVVTIPLLDRGSV